MRGRWAIWLAWVTATLVAALCAAPANAQAGMIGQRLAVCIVADARATPAAILRRSFPRDCATPQTDRGPGDYWAVAAVPRSLAADAPSLRMASLWQDRATIYVHYADGAIRRHRLGPHDASRAMQLGAIIAVPLKQRAAPIDRIAWHVEGAANLRGIVVGATISGAAEGARSNLMLGAIYAGFVGLAVALLIYNLALFAALRYRFQIAYCVMLGALIVYATSSSGALAWLSPDIANNDRIRINYLMLACSAAAALSFARSFFEPRVFAGWVGRLATGVAVAMVGSALLFVALAPWQIHLLDRVYVLTFVALLLTVLPVLWRAWRLRSNYLWLFALGWAAPIGLACLRLAGNLSFIGWNFWIDNSTILSMTVEALLSSLAIAYRIRLLSQERDVAREQEIAARLLADADPLTGLLNRRAFLREAIGRAGDQHLLILDLDHFKAVNDTLGHDGGDEVLRIVARALRAAAPTDAVVARIGGEEFAIVVDRAAALSPEAVLSRIRAERFPFDLTVTASAGSCAGPLTTEADWKTLYRHADQALFAAKAAGRDRARLIA